MFAARRSRLITLLVTGALVAGSVAGAGPAMAVPPVDSADGAETEVPVLTNEEAEVVDTTQVEGVEPEVDSPADFPLAEQLARTSRVVGGAPTAITSVPWQVALLDTSQPNNYLAQFCGGTILSANWILTAAHCVDNMNPGQIRVLAGTANLSSTSLSGVAVGSIVIHSSYNPVSLENDIALLRLSSRLIPSENVVPINIPAGRPGGGTSATISGWGLTCYVDEFGDWYLPCGSEVWPSTLQAAQVSIQSDAACRTELGSADYLALAMLCASTPDYWVDTCQGDSGGPLAYFSEGRWYLAGITSWGFGCGWISPGVYTNVGNYKSWIEANAPNLPPPGFPSSSRLSGGDRFDTAVAISQSEFTDPSVVDTVVLATGYGFADALSAASLATKLGGPLLLTQPDVLTAATEREIARLDPSRVIIVGGEPAVGAPVADRLSTLGYTVERLSGPDRFATSIAIAERGWGDSGAESVFLATGLNFPDALSASVAAAGEGMPVVLVNGGASSLTDAQLALLSELGADTAHIAGSAVVVSAGIEAQLDGLNSGSFAVSRYAGTDRINTSALIAQEFGTGGNPVYIAQGWNFPDALAGAAVAGARDGVLVLSQKECLSAGLRPVFQELRPASVTLLGGVPALSERVSRYEYCG